MPPLSLSDLAPEVVERVHERNAAVRQFSSLASLGDTLHQSFSKDTEQRRALDAEFALRQAIKQEWSLTGKRGPSPYAQGWISFAIGLAIIVLLTATRVATKETPAPYLIALPFIVIFIYKTLREIRADFKSLNSGSYGVSIPSPTLVALLRTFGRTETEGVYARAAAEIFEAESVLTPSAARGLLTSLNELLSASIRLETEQRNLDAALATQSLPEIEAEHTSLFERQRTTTDSAAREILSESMALCARRLDRARQLAPLQERVAAQLEGITQTMRSVQASVAALRLAPSGGELVALQETARGLAQRTQAIEDAVQEVLRIAP